MAILVAGSNPAEVLIGIDSGTGEVKYSTDGKAWNTGAGGSGTGTGSAVSEADYTSFDVYPTSSSIAVGATVSTLPAALTEEVPEKFRESLATRYAISASSTHEFTVRSYHDQDEIDVIVDWGDGVTTDLATATPTIVEAEHQYKIQHTYGVADKKYKVKILGKNYFAIEQAAGVASNILCGCFGRTNRVAKHLTNLSSFAKYAYRLLYVNFQSYTTGANTDNCANMFLNCRNLYAAEGFSRLSYLYSCQSIFSTCRSLYYTDFKLPMLVGDEAGYRDAFCDCLKLTVDISSLFPSGGLVANGKRSARSLFRNCSSLYGTAPAKQLWNNPNIEWDINYASDKLPFYATGALGSPYSWGGEEPDNIIDVPAAPMRKIVRDGNSATVSLAVGANTTYVYNSVITKLTLTSVPNSMQESTIYFTAGTSITVVLPSTVKTIGSMEFVPGASYVISIKDGVAISAEIS